MKKIISYLLIALFVSTASYAAVPTSYVSAAHEEQEPTSAELDELYIMSGYLHSAPAVPKKTIKSPSDVEPILATVRADFQTETYEAAKANMSTMSIEMFNQMPLAVAEINKISAETDNVLKSISKPKIYKGGMYASVKVKTKEGRKKTETTTTYLVKENGVWKMDYIQSLKKMLKIK